MFNQTFVNGREKTRKPLTLMLSLFMQVAAICVLILVPLVYTQALPSAQLKSLLVAPPPPRPMPSSPPVAKLASKAVVHRLNTQRLIAPVVIPKKVILVSDAAPAPDLGVFASNGNATAASNPMDGVVGSMPDLTSPPPPASQPKVNRRSGPVRVGGVIAEANLVRKVQPVYPALAKSARIQGTVEFTAIISKDGNIENLQLVKGHPLLVNAAKEAVLQWKYRPTLLNGQPVEVITDIVVNFTLAQ